VCLRVCQVRRAASVCEVAEATLDRKRMATQSTGEAWGKGRR